MRGVMLEVPPHLLEERRRLGVDRWDEMWEGVLHMVPPPAERHQSLGSALLAVLHPLARARGLKAAYEIGFFLADDDFRVPDLAVYRPDQASPRGLEGRAELVVELVSPGDDSRAKLPWYLAHGVREVVLIDRDSLAVELYVPGQEAEPDRVDAARSHVLDCSFDWLGADRLTIVIDGRRVQITP
jgi:Uma2 family endonuclease